MFRGVFAKFQGPGEFLILLNYFSMEKLVNGVYSLVDRVHMIRRTGPKNA
jgi:hypothetical protein